MHSFHSAGSPYCPCSKDNLFYCICQEFSSDAVTSGPAARGHLLSHRTALMMTDDFSEHPSVRNASHHAVALGVAKCANSSKSEQ